MIKNVTEKIIEAVRERERERVILAKSCFDFDAKNIIKRYKKRIGLIEEVLKNRIRLFRESLSFLRACEVIGAKDKYA